MSLYDPLIPEPTERAARDLERVKAEFERASRPFLGSPWTWLTWSIVLPGAALLTSRQPPNAYVPILLTWSFAILIGSLVEGVTIFRRAQKQAPTPLASWVLRAQGNLSLVGLALSGLLIWQGAGWALPALWLLLLGHSFYIVGGLAFPAFRASGLIYQFGGLLALAPHGRTLEVFAATAAISNLWMAAARFRTPPASEVDS